MEQLPVLVLNHFDGATVTDRQVIDIADREAGTCSDAAGNAWRWTPTKSELIRATLTLEAGHADNVNLSLEFPHARWSVENFVLVPGAAYNGNRYTSRRIGYPPLLTEPADIGPDVPWIINDIPRLNLEAGPSRFHIRSGDAAVPAIGFFSPSASRATVVHDRPSPRLLWRSLPTSGLAVASEP